ncbi:tetratricopeptide repeat protein [Flavobacterium sp.]|uniref:tetratricopeptide repeat protein n=1 Tax=Flavobacterium sp. TaxID=239 RepID=UPI00262E05DA|nr:tetratricopeptide repeat protein [Flavobacterium sp.]
MKKFFYLFLFISASVFATDVSNPFVDGNLQYNDGKYEAAITSYESVLANGQQSAELYFNLGNCYYKLHKVAPAIYNYEKALQLNPNDQEIQTNLDFARKMAIDDIKIIPKVGFDKLISDFTSCYQYDTWAWIAVVFGFVFLAFFIGYYFSLTAFKKRIYFTGMFVVLMVIIISVSAGISEKNRLETEKTAIVFAETASVKGEPKASSTETILLHEGTKVYILESIANWKKVQLTDETTGWISDEAIKEL